MDLQKFKYTGQQPHNSTILIEEAGKKVRRDIRLAAGDTAELPGDHPVIKDLITAGLLSPVDIKQTSSNKKPQ